MQPFFHDRHQDVDRNRDPDLGDDGVLGGPEERLDAKMLLEPAKEQFYLPAATIELGHGERGELKVVGEEAQAQGGFRVYEFDEAQLVWVIAASVVVGEHDGLIAAQSGVLVHRPGVEATVPGVAFDPGDEEGELLGQGEKPGEVEVSPVEDVEGAGFDGQEVQGFDIVDRPGGDVDPAGDVAAQVEQSVSLDGGLGLSEFRPGEEGEAKTDGGGVEGVGGLVEVGAEGIGGVKLAGFLDQDVGEVGPDAKGALFVGVGHGVAGGGRTHSHVPEFGLMGAQTTFDIAQTLAGGQLGEGHAQVLVHAGEVLDIAFAVVSPDAAGELGVREKLHNLGKDGLSLIHGPPPKAEYSPGPNSNRFRARNSIYSFSTKSFVASDIVSWDGRDAKYEFETIDWINRGTENWGDFSSFVFRQNGIDILFSPYQVASFADGPQVAKILYKDFRDMIRPEFRKAIGLQLA
jgi:hypothetical protein